MILNYSKVALPGLISYSTQRYSLHTMQTEEFLAREDKLFLCVCAASERA